MRTPLFISTVFVASLLCGGNTTAKADSALAVVPFSTNYTIEELGVVQPNEGGYEPEIIGFDDKGTFAVNARSYGEEGVYIRRFPVQSASIVQFLFPVPDRKSYRIAARNKVGQVVGVSNSRVFIWKPNDMRYLPFLSSKASLSHAVASDVNDKGQIVGDSLMETANSRGQYKSATLWDGGQAFELESAPDFMESHALSISNTGQIAGNIERRNGIKPKSKAASWTSKRLQILEGDGESAATHINERGQIAGWWEDPTAKSAEFSRRPAIWQNGKKYNLGEVVEFKGRDFGGALPAQLPGGEAVETQGGYSMEPKGFNNLGQMVGNMNTFDGCVGSSGAFYFDGQLHNLQTLAPKDREWELLSADAINNHSQIIGTALHKGHRCVFLLSPAPVVTKKPAQQLQK